MTYPEMVQLCKDKNVKMVDFRFTDVPGTWQHFSIPLSEFSPSVLSEGIGFDGSSIRGFKSIEESDMLLRPDLATAFVDPFCQIPTLSVTCNVMEPISFADFTNDPRYIARQAERYLRETGIADTAYFGPEAEFFILDHVEYENNNHYCYYAVDSEEGIWNSGRTPNPEMKNHGYKVRNKEGYFPVPPADRYQDLRTEMVLELERAGITVERQHHEVATAGQAEIDIRFDSLVAMADKLMLFKYIIKNVARKFGKTVTFMPKPIFGDNGSGMHTHQSLWKEGKPLFYEASGFAHLSNMARWYIGGLLKHAPAILAFAAPSTNSYKRLVPGYEAPVNLVYSVRNRSAAIRIPTYSEAPAATRLEFRPPDPTANPYLAFSAMLMAGLDGIQNRIDPGEPVNEDIFSMSKERLASIPSVPDSLDKVLIALEQDHGFLTKGGVFTEGFIQSWIQTKREKEIDPLRMRPHPYEFYMYFDA